MLTLTVRFQEHAVSCDLRKLFYWFFGGCSSIGRMADERINFCPWDGYRYVLEETRCGRCGEERNAVIIVRRACIFLGTCNRQQHTYSMHQAH
jgi:NAD-dependent dihydropyrimidine dehydrogenase PreA subunit